METLKNTDTNRARINAISDNSTRIDVSRIAGFGLFAEKVFVRGQVIMEYKGVLIRAELGDVREKNYGMLNKEQYMFRLNDDFIIDATEAGNEARFINHSCHPNCYAQVFEDGTNSAKDKVLIIAKRRIRKSEELSYDYNYEIEDGEDKIPCRCGAVSCKMWMN